MGINIESLVLWIIKKQNRKLVKSNYKILTFNLGLEIELIKRLWW